MSLEESISSPEGSPARISPSQENKQESQAEDPRFSMRSLELLAWFDLNTCCWRIPQTSSVEGGGAWFSHVLSSLAEIGYDAVWECISAAQFGACHKRERVWILAWDASNIDSLRCKNRDVDGLEPRKIQTTGSDQCDGEFPNTQLGKEVFVEKIQSIISRAFDERQKEWWSTEPSVVRVVHGLPCRVDRVKSLGNSIVPQIAEMWGKVINRIVSGEKRYGI